MDCSCVFHVAVCSRVSRLELVLVVERIVLTLCPARAKTSEECSDGVAGKLSQVVSKNRVTSDTSF